MNWFRKQEQFFLRFYLEELSGVLSSNIYSVVKPHFYSVNYGKSSREKSEERSVFFDQKKRTILKTSASPDRDIQTSDTLNETPE